MRTPYKGKPGYMTRVQAARYLGVSDWMFRQHVSSFNLPEKKHRGVFIYQNEDIENLARKLANDS